MAENALSTQGEYSLAIDRKVWRAQMQQDLFAYTYNSSETEGVVGRQREVQICWNHCTKDRFPVLKTFNTYILDH